MPAAEAPPRSGRDAATRAIARLAARYPDLPPLSIDDAGLERREAAFAHAITSAVCRRWLTLSFLIEKATGRRLAALDGSVRAALLAGAAQLVLLDRVPAHAAIDETVEWTKRFGVRKAAGLVNAVLRKVAALAPADAPRRATWSDARDELPRADGSARPLASEVLPADADKRLSIAASVPRELLQKWQADAGHDAARERALHALVHPPTVLNTAHAEKPLPDSLAAHEQAGSHIVAIGTDPRAVLAHRSDVWAQDATSAAALGVALGLAPSTVIDVCAGRGTKTRQLAAIFRDAEIIAAEVDTDRLEDLRATFSDHPRVRVCHGDDLARGDAAAADVVLLDVPCSNTGVLARRPEARYRFGTGQPERLARTQRQILASALELLSPGGRILYSTCSLEPEENGAVVAWAEDRLGLRCERRQFIEPRGKPGDPPTQYHDGGFAALLTRSP